MVTYPELAAMRADVTALMPDVADLDRRTVTNAGATGQTATWSTVAVGLPARLAPAGARTPSLAVFADRLGSREPYQVTVPADADVRTGDRLRIDGRTFDVVSAPRRSWQVALVCLATEVL